MAKNTNSSASPIRSDRTNNSILADYLTLYQLAAELGVSVRTLHRWHGLRCGPPRITVGHTILYNVAAVRRWLQDHEVEPMRSAGNARRRHD